MGKIIDFAEKQIKKIEDLPLSFSSWITCFICLMIIRIVLENILIQESKAGIFIFYEFFDSFLVSLILSFAIVRSILKIECRKILNVLLFGYLVIIIPPVVDWFLSRGKLFLSFYAIDDLGGLFIRYLTFFGDSPTIGITYGIRVEIFCAVILIFIYSLFKSRNIFKSLAVLILTYSVLFFLGTFPSWIAIAIKGFPFSFFKVSEINIVQMFLSPFCLFSREINSAMTALIIKVNLIYVLILTCLVLGGLFIYQRKKFVSFFHNIRLPQICYHGGLLFLGMGIGIITNSPVTIINFFNFLGILVLLEAIIFAWLASVVANDIADEKTDFLSNQNRPLIKKTFSLQEYQLLGIILFIVSIYLAFLVSPKIAFLLISYQAIAWIYSCWPFRLKRFAFISTFVSSLASILIFFSGYILYSPEQNTSGIPPAIIALLIISYTFSLPMKDFKDIEGDKKDQVFTIPVLFGEYWGKIIVGSGIFFSFLLSVVLLNEKGLFWWALFFGGMAFWLIVKMSPSKRSVFIEKKDQKNSLLNYTNIFWWMLGIVSAYLMVILRLVFL